MSRAAEVFELTRKFGDFTAVDRVTFTVEEGEIFGFLGPNGAGKTTTIKMLTGLLRPTSGSARVGGYDVVDEVEQVKLNIGYMSQLFSLYPDLTALENIQLFAGLYGVSGPRFAERRDWVLEMAGLIDYRDRLTGQLPLGFKQRLALGCAVLHEPPILFLDEPTSGVDPISRRNFWDLIYGFAEAGTTVFVSTHYMEEAEYSLDRPSALKAEIREPILEVLTEDPPKAVEALSGGPGIIEVTMFGRAIHVMVEDQTAGERQIPETLEAAGQRVAAIRPIEPSLEDVFVCLVRRSGGTVTG
ncbi:MAG: multidrug ABC transporter ATP-binding protein [Gemmatimonas sp. SM23_52]|nr:MAG: multidrug ABC transporter ATP-binding protein [Gemmatimonas sp. SM23_52]